MQITWISVFYFHEMVPINFRHIIDMGMNYGLENHRLLLKIELITDIPD